jgi:hypothetical protein
MTVPPKGVTTEQASQSENKLRVRASGVFLMTLLAVTYPLLATFLTLLWFAGFVLFIFLALAVFADVFASSDLSGWAKAGWIAIVFILPLIGVLIYVITRGESMQRHSIRLLHRELGVGE